ncbi:hypothetical protein GE107_00505 [Cohnella sp. CFH 77786]|uniref:hypothetical protein n=1 Tax=Cohnella sp. CFH 77786 TaxID=2662265 RepID=UPI001C60DCC9|nr:hypothetical protein [Cohnella sp. CFH 77786]MBW5444545.1 hypothetical protein [Cohnella sp. CFH 77786]
MRKHRKWLMGFGIGIMLGASMLQLILFARSQEQALMVAEGPKTYTQEQLDEEVAKAVEETKRQLPSATPSASPGGSGGESALKPGSAAKQPGDGASTQPGGEASASPAQPGQTSPDGGGGRVVAFYVNRGMSLRTVALSLKALGLIEDAGDFTEAARSISRKMEVGTATFTGHPTYEEIMAELTRKKD